MRTIGSVLSAVALAAACAGSTGGVEAEAGDKRASGPGEAADVKESERQAGPDGRGMVQLLPAGHDPTFVNVEVVFTPAGRQRGLMHRKELAQNAGMLFLFERERQQSFWMRNTYLPLDMVFIRSDMTVLGVVENAEPLTEESRAVPGASRFVLEVNAGYCRKYGVVAGTRVQFADVEDELAALPGGAP